MDIHWIILTIWSCYSTFCGILIIWNNPSEKNYANVAMLIAAFISPPIFILQFPFAIYKGLEGGWASHMRAEQQRVKRQ